MYADVCNYPELKTTVLAPANVNRVANLPMKASASAQLQLPMEDVSLSRPERHSHDDFTSPRQDTNFAHAGSRSFPRVSDRVFKRGRPCEKRRSRRGCSSANLPSEAKGLNFDYLWSHVVSPTKGDRDRLFHPLSCFCGKLLDIIRASAIVRTCSISFVDGRRAVLDRNETPSVEARDCSRTSAMSDL